jgi:hypothetical protein
MPLFCLGPGAQAGHCQARPEAGPGPTQRHSLSISPGRPQSAGEMLMVYILKGKVSWLRLMAITWTQNSC